MGLTPYTTTEIRVPPAGLLAETKWTRSGWIRPTSRARWPVTYVTSLLRNALVLLLAVTLGGAALAQSVGVPGGAECAVQLADLSGEGCCGDAASASGCAVCATGCGLFMPAATPPVSVEFRFAPPSVPPLSSSAAHARAPDTAPPKSSFA